MLENKQKSTLGGDISLKGIARLIKDGKATRITILAGAGLSVAAGIPDFRSPKFGLYELLQGCSRKDESSDTIEKYKDAAEPMGSVTANGRQHLAELSSVLPELLPHGISPEAMFDLSMFSRNPKPFCLLAKHLLPGPYRPTIAHFLPLLLHKKGLLVRHYTQNIDCLELISRLPADKIVEAHGSFADAHCTKCHSQHRVKYVRDCILNEWVPRCNKPVRIGTKKAGKLYGKGSSGKKETAIYSAEKESIYLSPNSAESRTLEDSTGVDTLTTSLEKLKVCKEKSTNPTENGAERKGMQNLVTASVPETGISNREEGNAQTATTATKADASAETQQDDFVQVCGGTIKPDIVFFGENLSKRFFFLVEEDFAVTDLLIVMGTSLQVAPFAGLIGKCDRSCPRLLINREPVGLRPQRRKLGKTETEGSQSMESESAGEDFSFADGSQTFDFFSSKNYRDVFFRGECDDGVLELCELLGWKEELLVLYNNHCEEHKNIYEASWDLLEKFQNFSG